MFFFLIALPMGIWQVPLGNIMDAYGLRWLLPWVLATGSISAFLSPLFIGALADRVMAPTQLLAMLCLATGLCLSLTSRAIEGGWGPAWVLTCAMGLSLVSAPIWSLTTTVVLSQLHQPGRQFGPVRAWATVGWMAGGWLVSYGLRSDSSVLSGYVAAGFWVAAGVWTAFLPRVKPEGYLVPRSWRERLGLDALVLLKDPNHRMVFLTAAFYSVPLAAFYPYGVMHLKALGMNGPSGLMTIGQVTEVLVMLVLARLMAEFRLKWVFLSGIGFGLVRYLLFALDERTWLVLGIAMHGFAYTLYFITTQIYLEARIEVQWRARAQALLTLLTAGFGNLAGYLGSGWWFARCHGAEAQSASWTTFWMGLAILNAVVFGLFALFYKGRGRHQDG